MISRNEASESQYVSAYLANHYTDKFEIHPEKYVSGPSGHRPVDFSVVFYLVPLDCSGKGPGF